MTRKIESKIEEGKKSLHSAILMLDLDNIPERREWLIKQLEYLVRDIEREIEDK